MNTCQADKAITLEKIISLCKRRGFIYQSSEIYSGLNGVYDTGPIGTLLKQNIRKAWSQAIKEAQPNILFIEGSILGPEMVWQASGHTQNFQDPMIDCLNCKKRFRADDPDFDINKACPSCGLQKWTDVRQFNLMFKTNLGASEESSSIAYLRPETAQAIFINFKNVYSTSRVKIPFGIAQIGKAFRNEITPKQFLFRMREFEQMELEWFCKPEQSEEFFKSWIEHRKKFYSTIGLDTEKIRVRPHEKTELSHYSSQTSDIEYKFPFGWKELEGIADRSNYDLSQHAKLSGKDLSVFDEETKTSYLPNVVECSVGTDRLFLTLLFDAYCEEEVSGESSNSSSASNSNSGNSESAAKQSENTKEIKETRIVLKLSPIIAPYIAAIFPLTKQQNDNALKIYRDLTCKGFNLQFDQSGSIGKRYRRQDEIGTPFCITYDFDTDLNQTVTIRDRDTMTQERVSIDKLEQFLKDKLNISCL